MKRRFTSVAHFLIVNRVFAFNLN